VFNMAYSPLSYNVIGWKNRSESLTTPLGKTNLNHMDEMIYNIVLQLNEAYNELDIGKLDKENANGLVSGVDYNSTTGVFTFSFYGTQTTKTVDLNIEKIPVSFSMDANGIITMTTADGTEWTADIGSLIPVFNFTDSSTIDFTVTGSGEKNVTATIKPNSVTDSMMQPNYLADITTQAGIATAQANNAKSYADNASFDAKLAQSYAVGGSGVRSGEDTDNAKYYKEQAEFSYNKTKEIADNQEDVLEEMDKKLNIATFSVDDDGNLIYSDDSSFSFTVDDNGDLNWEVV